MTREEYLENERLRSKTKERKAYDRLRNKTDERKIAKKIIYEKHKEIYNKTRKEKNANERIQCACGKYGSKRTMNHKNHLMHLATLVIE